MMTSQNAVFRKDVSFCCKNITYFYRDDSCMPGGFSIFLSFGKLAKILPIIVSACKTSACWYVRKDE